MGSDLFLNRVSDDGRFVLDQVVYLVIGVWNGKVEFRTVLSVPNKCQIVCWWVERETV